MTQLVLTGHKNFTPIEHFMDQLVVLDPQNKINSTGVPQGSVLSPLFLNLYMVLLVTIIRNHNISCHSYTDDVHLYSAFSSDDLTCTDDINCWMPPNLLEQKQNRNFVVDPKSQRQKNVVIFVIPFSEIQREKQQCYHFGQCSQFWWECWYSIITSCTVDLCVCFFVLYVRHSDKSDLLSSVFSSRLSLHCNYV